MAASKRFKLLPLTFVTGNPNKLREASGSLSSCTTITYICLYTSIYCVSSTQVKSILGNSLPFEIVSKDVDRKHVRIITNQS